MFKKIYINLKFIVKKSFEFTAAIFAILGFIGTLAPLDSIISEEIPMVIRVGISVGTIIAIWLFLFIAISIYLVKKSRFKVLAIGNNYHVYVQYGDVFSSGIVINEERRRKIVIPVNRCFDTVVDDDLITSNTLHGTSMKKLYQDGRYNEQSLDHDIQKYLEKGQYAVEIIGRAQKKKGNLKRYPIGTMAEIRVDDKLTYFFLGLSALRQDLHAEMSNEEYALALIRMIEFCNARSQGFPVIIPLIGAGHMRRPEKDVLQYLVMLLKMNRDLVNCDIHIVIPIDAMDRISIADVI